MDVQLAAETKFEGAEEAGGLYFLSAGDDAGEGLVGSQAKRILTKNRALIQIGGYEMGGHPDDFHALVVGLPIGGGTGKSREQGGVNV